MSVAKTFGRMLTDDNGAPSEMRVAKFVVIVSTAVVWTVISLVELTLHDIPPNVLYLNVALITGKAVQKFGEKKEKENTNGN